MRIVLHSACHPLSTGKQMVNCLPLFYYNHPSPQALLVFSLESKVLLSVLYVNQLTIYPALTLNTPPKRCWSPLFLFLLIAGFGGQNPKPHCNNC